MKIAIYAIACNEIRYVERFMKSCEGANSVVVCDTGSSDGTQEMLRSLGAVVYDHQVSWDDWPKDTDVDKWKKRLGRPWRFDVARNKSLSYVPDDFDVCISLDLDELLCPGWRAYLEKAWTPDTTRLRYRYIWSHHKDGSPDIEYWAEKIHSRHGYIWHHPVHECLYKVGGGEKQVWSDIVLEHFPDSSKSRGGYFPLLELAVEEDPNNDRNSHYLGREYFFRGQYADAEKELKRHLSLPSAQWDAERAASMRYLAKCCAALGKKDQNISWLLRACAEAPGEREPWLELAQAYYDKKEYVGGYFAAKQALKITSRPPTYITSGFAWGSAPYDLAGICSYNIGLHLESREHMKNAYLKSPNDQRLIANLKFANRSINPVIPMTFHIVVSKLDEDILEEWLKSRETNNRIIIYGPGNLVGPRDDIICLGYNSFVECVNNLPDDNFYPGDVVVLSPCVVTPPSGWDRLVFDKFSHFTGGVFVDNRVAFLDFGCYVKEIFGNYKDGLLVIRELYSNLSKLNLAGTIDDFVCYDNGFSFS